MNIDRKAAVVLAGLKGEELTTNLCRRHGTSERALYRWRAQFLEGGKGTLPGSSPFRREESLKGENEELKLVVAGLSLGNRFLAKLKAAPVREYASQDVLRPLKKAREEANQDPSWFSLHLGHR